MTYRRCKCPVWVFGSVQGRRIREALDTTSWDRAEEILRARDPVEAPVTMTLAEAGARFIADCERRNGADTTAKYRLMIGEMKDCLGSSLEIRALRVDDLSRYSEGWKMAPITAGKKLERLRSFFRFCMERGWCSFNPAVGIKKPNAKFKQRMPFTDAEVEKILWATEIYPIKGIYRKDSPARIKAFVLLLIYSGIRIRDAVTLDVSRFVGDEKLLIPTQKTGQPVVLPLPPDVAKIILALKKPESPYFFWTGNGLPKSAVADWQRSLRKLFKLAGVKGHAHRFRTTFAVRLLEKGVSLEAVAALLGNSIKVAEKHYAPWVQSRQLALEESVKKTWA
jgi:integrase/recombinase XerD